MLRNIYFRIISYIHAIKIILFAQKLRNKYYRQTSMYPKSSLKIDGETVMKWEEGKILASKLDDVEDKNT